MEVISPEPFKARLELHPPRLCATSCSIFPDIPLHLILYLLLIHSLPYSPTFYHHYPKWNLRPARWGITIHRRIKKHTLREHWHSRKVPILVVHQMFAFQRESCIVLRMTNVSDCIIEVGWWYRSGAQWWRKLRPQRVHLVVWHQRRRFRSPIAGPASRPGAPGQVVTNYKGSIAKETELCQYCYCTPSASKSPKCSWGNGATTAQIPKVNPPQQIIRVWPCTIHPGAAATHV